MNCQHPGCTEECHSTRASYCARHSTKAMQERRRRERKAGRLGAMLDQRTCVACGAIYTRTGRNQKYCPQHRDMGRESKKCKRPGAVYVPEGMTYDEFAAVVTAGGIGMSRYAAKRRMGQTHEQAMRRAQSGRKTLPRLYPLTAEQQRANELLRAWRCLAA